MAQTIKLIKTLSNKQATPASNHGTNFNQYQERVKAKGVEGFLTPQSKHVLEVTNTKKQEVESIRKQYHDTLGQYEKIVSKVTGDTSKYLSRVNPANPYLNKAIRFTTGQVAYVTNQGVVKYIPSDEIWKSTNIPTNVVDVAIAWDNSYLIPNVTIPTTPPLITGTPVQKGQVVGNEGASIFVDRLLTDSKATYVGCYADDANSPTMSFINDRPPIISSVVNGDFSQPSLNNNSYKYIKDQSTVPGWVFNAVLLNNSNDWTYPVPYPTGNQCVSIQQTQTIQQTIRLGVGSYSLSFYACGRNCCDGSGKANPIDVLLNDVVIYSADAPINIWTKYTTPFNVSQNGNNVITFKGTWSSGDRSTALQSISIGMNSSASNGSSTYDMCKQSAIDGGYTLFALQNVNPETSTGYCAVSNDSIAAVRGGTSYAVRGGVAIWASGTSGQNTAVLSGRGTIDILNSAGAVIFSTPSQEPVNYMGCYGDKKTRAMTVHDKGSYKYNNASCRQAAEESGSTYYGLQNSRNGKNAQCMLSNDLSKVKQYGKASNCVKINDGSYSGSWWSNSVYSLDPDQLNNYYLYVQDDGNLCIYRGSGPDDNQGGVWCSETNGKQQKPNPQYESKNGKYGKQWIAAGSTLAAGDFVGSADGSTYLIMQGDGNLVLYTSTNEINCKTMKDTNTGGGAGANAVYRLSETGMPSNMNKLSYVGDNSELYSYPSSSIGLDNTYKEILNFDSAGYDLQGSAYSGTTLDSCKSTCNSNPDCHGFVFTPSNGACYPKDKGMYPNGVKQANSSANLYVRNSKPVNTAPGLSNVVNSVDSVKYQKYNSSGKVVGGSYGVASATHIQKQELEQLQSKLDFLTKRMIDTTGVLGSRENAVNERISANIRGVEGFQSSGYLTQLKDTRKKIVRFSENVDNILDDSNIVFTQQNYSYLLWSVLAIGTVLISINVVRK
jgi:hypothetical protein